MRKFVLLCSISILASAAMGQSLVGKWRIVAKKNPSKSATMHFKDAKTGSIETGARGANIYQGFTYKLKGGVLTLTPAGNVKINGKSQGAPSSNKPLVLKIKWKSKDVVLVQSMRDGKPFGDLDEMRRVK